MADPEVLDQDELIHGIVKNPARAAILLRDGAIVDYQPGDGTRYECVLVHRTMTVQGQLRHAVGRWLIVRNLKIFVDITNPIDLLNFCLTPNTRGTWAAMKPVLAVLGALRDPGNPGTGAFEYDPVDARMEAVARVTYDGGPLNEKDARLGSFIRRQVEGGA